jgi:Mrp family chromosome partitioning ATPase
MRVLLVEADLRRPTLGRMLRLSPGISLESLLSGKHRLAEAVQIEPKSGLHCLTASGSAPNVIKALQSTWFSMLMKDAQASYDMVFMDSPPMMLVVDPLILSKYSDVILFAVAFGRTSSDMVAEALHRFPTEVRSRVATVLTRVPQSEAAWQGYYAGYQRKLPASA